MTLKEILWAVQCFTQVHVYVELEDSYKEYEGAAFEIFELLDTGDIDTRSFLKRKVDSINVHTCDDLFVELEVYTTMEEVGSDI